MDISNYDTREKSSEGIEWTIKDEWGDDIISEVDGQPIKIRTKGLDTPEAQARIAKINKGLKPKSDMTAYGKAIENSDAKLFAWFIIGWTDNMMHEGEPFKYSPENAFKLMKVAFFRDQQAEVLRDRSNFMKKASD